MYKVTQNFETPKSTSTDPSCMLLHILKLSILIQINRQRGHQQGKFGSQTLCRATLSKHMIQFMYFLRGYAIFVSSDKKRQRGGRDFWEPCFMIMTIVSFSAGIIGIFITSIGCALIVIICLIIIVLKFKKVSTRYARYAGTNSFRLAVNMVTT